MKTAEGFSKRELFQKLAPLEEATRPLMAKARKTLGASKGQSALQPWNISYSLSGGDCMCVIFCANPTNGAGTQHSACNIHHGVAHMHDMAHILCI